MRRANVVNEEACQSLLLKMRDDSDRQRSSLAPARRGRATGGTPMAVNKPIGDNARKGAVKKRTQLRNALPGTSTKRNKEGGRFMAVKKRALKFKGVRRERQGSFYACPGWSVARVAAPWVRPLPQQTLHFGG
jgi:hypothetical protein